MVQPCSGCAQAAGTTRQGLSPLLWGVAIDVLTGTDETLNTYDSAMGAMSGSGRLSQLKCFVEQMVSEEVHGERRGWFSVLSEDAPGERKVWPQHANSFAPHSRSEPPSRPRCPYLTVRGRARGQ